MNIHGYILQGALKNDNSGFSKWGFAVKDGREYFLKELINPVYPQDKSLMSEDVFNNRVKYCSEYEKRLRSYFEKVNEAGRGNLVRINEFFRCGSRYYLVTEKVDGTDISVRDISLLSEDKKQLLLKSAAFCFKDLHAAGVVHFDVKPANLLIKITKSGNYVAKLIDFDSGFCKDNIPDCEELGGDLTYLAPETFLKMFGEDVYPDEKVDIFALGLVFHEYYCGCLPWFDNNEYEYPYEALLDGGELKIEEEKMPDDIGALIASMLNVDPAARPSAEEIVNKLSGSSLTDACADISYIAIQFNGVYGKYIGLQEDCIRYNNILHPSVAAETVNFPEEYTAHNTKNITPSQFNKIIKKLSDSGLFEILSPEGYVNRGTEVVTGDLYVMYGDGTKAEYSAAGGVPCEQFNRIAEVLSGYCEFLEIDPLWYESPENRNVEAVEVREVKNDNWFRAAGDL